MKTEKVKNAVSRYGVALMTLLVMGFLIAFYFLFYVSKQDHEITKRNFRALNRVTYNINTRLNDYSKLYLSAWEDNRHLVCNAGYGVKDPNKNLQDTIFKKLGQKIERVLSDTIATKFDANDNIKLDEPGENTFISFEYKCELKNKERHKLQISLKGFLKPLLQQDIFDNYLLIQDSVVIYKDLQQGIMMNKFDSLFEKNAILKTSSVQKIKFSGENYTLYIVPFYFNGKTKCALVGMIATSKLDGEKYAIPQNFLLGVILTLLFIFISFPFIKTLLMNSNERLRTLDILTTFFAFFMGTGIIIFILLQFYTQNKNYFYEQDESLKSLSDSIRTSFINDVTTAYRQLSCYDSLVHDFPHDIANIKKDTVILIHDKECRSMYPFYPYFKLVFWMNSAGMDTIQWTTESKPDVKTNYSSRLYFKNIRTDATWKLPGAVTSSPFFMQPVYSWTDGQFKAILAKNSMIKEAVGKDSVPFVAALSARLPSVINPVLPLGYSFCIIDENGDVLFHSDKKKSLNENFKEECNNSSLIESAIKARSSVYFEQYYSAENRAMHISPIQDLPLYLVTMRNASYTETANFEIFSFTSLFLFANVIFMVLMFLGLVSIQQRQTKLKSSLLQVEWLWPVNNKSPLYGKLFIYTTVMCILTMILSTPKHPLLGILLIFTNSLLITTTYFYVNTILTDSDKKSRKSIWFLIFLSAIDFFILALAFKFLTKENILILILYQVFIIIMAYYLFHKSVLVKLLPSKSAMKFNFLLKLKYKDSYVLMLLAWIILSAVIPVYILYKISYNHEMESLVKQNQLHIAQRINKLTNNNSADGYIYFGIVNNKKLGIQNCYTSILNNTVILDSIPAIDEFVRPKELKSFSRLINKLKLLINNTNREQGQIYDDKSSDLSFSWKYFENESDRYVVLTNHDVLKSRDNLGDTLFIKSKVPLYPAPMISTDTSDYRSLNLFVPLFLFAVILFSMIRFFIGKLFITNYFTIKQASKVKAGPNYSLGTKSIIVSLPRSGKSGYLKELIATRNLKSIDFTFAGNETQWKEALEGMKPYEQCKGVLITNFEYNLGNKPTNDKKLAFIELLLTYNISNIIIVSAIHPEAFLSTLRKDKTNTDLTQLEIESNYYQWVSIFSSFDVCYFPLSVSSVRHEEVTNIKTLFENESMYGTYLPAIKDKMLAYVKEQPGLKYSHELEEEMILKFQNIAYPYYLSIWNSLTREEQYLLYDLAEDGLTNYKSREIITTLFNKGLIINNHQLPAIMNLSFKNFILTEVKAGSAILDDKLRSEGSLWNSFKIPFYIVIAVVVIFIFYTQQESFNKMTTFLTTFAALIPLLLRLFGFMSGSKSEPQTSTSKTP